MQNSFDIAYDISFLPSTGGFGTHTTQLLHYFIRHDAENDYLILENELPPIIPQYQNQEDNRKARWIDLPINWRHVKTNRHSRVLWMLLDLPKLIKKYRPEVFFCLDNVTVPKKTSFSKTVLILHDMIPISHPEYCRYRDAMVAGWLMKRAIRNSHKIITVSNYSAGQIALFFPNLKSQLEVVYDGVDHARFFPISNKETEAQALAKKFNLYSPQFILIVTTLSPRRNLVRFIEAYASHLSTTAEKETCLVIAGCRGWKDDDIFRTLKSLHLENRIHFLDFVTDEDLVHLNQSALVLANPSLLEGFGLTVLEAMACGTPVVCSNTTALDETSGNAALKIDPLNTEQISDAITLLVTKEDVRQEFSQKGIARAQQFHWEKTAKETWDVINSVLRK